MDSDAQWFRIAESNYLEHRDVHSEIPAWDDLDAYTRVAWMLEAKAEAGAGPWPLVIS